MGSVALTEDYAEHPLSHTHKRARAQYVNFPLPREIRWSVWRIICMCFIYDANSLLLPFFCFLTNEYALKTPNLCENATQRELWRSRILCTQFPISVSGLKAGPWLWPPVIFLTPLGSRFLELPYTYPTNVYLYAGLIKPTKSKKDRNLKNK